MKESWQVAPCGCRVLVPHLGASGTVAELPTLCPNHLRRWGVMFEWSGQEIIGIMGWHELPAPLHWQVKQAVDQFLDGGGPGCDDPWLAILTVAAGCGSTKASATIAQAVKNVLAEPVPRWEAERQRAQVEVQLPPLPPVPMVPMTPEPDPTTDTSTINPTDRPSGARNPEPLDLELIRHELRQLGKLV